MSDDWMTWKKKPGGEISRSAPRVLRTFWTMTHGTRRVSAYLCDHPIGFELRIIEGVDDLRRSESIVMRPRPSAMRSPRWSG